jgi:hypothetical protein
MVFFSGIPSDAAGPVALTTTPTLICAQTLVLQSSAAIASKRNDLFPISRAMFVSKFSLL